MKANLAPTNLHTLAISSEAMQRLLNRQAADGTLVLVDPALIKAAIEVGREQVASVRTMLAEVPHELADPWRGSFDSLIAAVAEVDDLLDMLQKVLFLAGG